MATENPHTDHHHGHGDHDHSDHVRAHNGHHHHHHHAGGHGHSHAPRDFGWVFAIGISLNLGFVLVEAVYGYLSNSVALLADAGHNFSDVLGLLVAWGATVLSRSKPGGRYSYGLRSSSILAALINALLLLLAISWIAIEAVQRFFEPTPIAGTLVIIVAAIGIVINSATALLFMRGSKGDINVRGAFLHMAADAVVSAGVVVAGLIILGTGWKWVDPLVSLVIVVVIAIGTWGLLRDAVTLSLHATPASIDPEQVALFLRQAPGVSAIHDLHIWAMSTTETALTAHLVIPAGYPGDGFTVDLSRELKVRFGIDHATIQIETDATLGCALEPDHVV